MNEKTRPQLESRLLAWSRKNNNNERGLRRQEPENPKVYPFADFDDYVLGFRAGVQQDFGIVLSHIEVPFDGHSYEAFLDGLAGFESEGNWGRMANHTGLTLLLLHLGYPRAQLTERRIEIYQHPGALEKYREDIEDLMKRKKIDPKNPSPIMPVYGNMVGALDPNPKTVYTRPL
ncbi:MAG: hypothetical protein A3B38_04200 [Candidatus Levybacteria bacterium RIFCSPLOWO2_01_FULL_36_13]|nr:MAG: hypothetical protein A2684_01125 [Candidatus Levybacteria bacterium RIFCSPHIGHO2_01_FULL_36_15b]OGH34328.1 MAG: hypothetical protein A3B38_04200 [Candidatus Levybacteria bacterium RIFCSPLOWO2_01_FULL_36_13]